MPRKRPQFTDGIFNYCDRWCERCRDTARCRLFHDLECSTRRHKRKGEDPTDWNVVFQDVSRNFRKLERMLRRTAKVHGLDLDAIAKEAAAAPPPRDRREAIKHPLCREGGRFFQGCDKLVKRLRPVYGEARRGAIRRSGFMDVQGEAKTLKRLRDAAEVLAWDGPLVYVKIRRAVDGWLEAREEAATGAKHPCKGALPAEGSTGAAHPWHPDAGEADGFHLDDARKTAGLVQRLLKRDKAALLAVYEWDERFERAAIDLLARTERLRRGLTGLFPA